MIAFKSYVVSSWLCEYVQQPVNVAGYWEMRESLFEENRKSALAGSDAEESGGATKTLWTDGRPAKQSAMLVVFFNWRCCNICFFDLLTLHPASYFLRDY